MVNDYYKVIGYDDTELIKQFIINSLENNDMTEIKVKCKTDEAVTVAVSEGCVYLYGDLLDSRITINTKILKNTLDKRQSSNYLGVIENTIQLVIDTISIYCNKKSL